MVDIKPFKGTRPFNEDAKSLIAPSTDHLSIENIEIFRKNNYWNYLKILNPVGQLKETDTLLEAKLHFSEMKENDVIKKDVKDHFYVYQIEFKEHIQTGFLSLANIEDLLFLLHFDNSQRINTFFYQLFPSLSMLHINMELLNNVKY